MPIFAPTHFSNLLTKARQGSRDALGKLLEPCRMNLAIAGQKLLPVALQGRVDVPELIQATFEAAIAGFPQFRGATEAELLVWLRQILKSQAANLAKHFLVRQKRDSGPQVSLDDSALGKAWRELLPDDDATPYTSLRRRERYEIMNQAFAQLKRDYQLVIELRHGSGKSFAAIAKELDKSEEAVAKTWKRALEAWRRAMADLGLSDW